MRIILFITFSIAAFIQPLGLSDSSKSLDHLRQTEQNMYEITNTYIHTWEVMPPISGQKVLTEETFTLTHVRGVSNVIIFLSSWCDNCRFVIEDLKKLEEKYQHLDVKFLYIFSHDTKEDASGFYRHFQIESEGILANHEILKSYHNPELPTIYFVDRKGFLSTRFLKFNKEGIEKIDKILTHNSSY